jgi:hypothetical protein
MAATTTSPKTKRKSGGLKPKGNSKAGPPAVALSSAQRVIMQNLVNMVMVMGSSGTVLLGLLAAKHFQIAHF